MPLDKKRDVRTILTHGPTALHENTPILQSYPNQPFLYISPSDVDVHRNWKYMLKNKTFKFMPQFVGVDSTGWYVVFDDSSNGRRRLEYCREQLEDCLFDCQTVRWSQPASIHLPPNNPRPREDASEDERPSKRLKKSPLDAALEPLFTQEEADLTDASMEISGDESSNANVLTTANVPPQDPALESVLTGAKQDQTDAIMEMTDDETVYANVLTTVTLPPLDLAPTWNVWGMETRQMLAST